MQAESLDVLETADVAPAQARAIVRAVEIAGARDTLATKPDVLALHQASDVLRAELRGDSATHGRAAQRDRRRRTSPYCLTRWSR